MDKNDMNRLGKLFLCFFAAGLITVMTCIPVLAEETLEKNPQETLENPQETLEEGSSTKEAPETAEAYPVSIDRFPRAKETLENQTIQSNDKNYGKVQAILTYLCADLEAFDAAMTIADTTGDYNQANRIKESIENLKRDAEAFSIDLSGGER